MVGVGIDGAFLPTAKAGGFSRQFGEVCWQKEKTEEEMRKLRELQAKYGNI